MSSTATSRRPARRIRLAAAAIALPLSLGAVLSGCSAGQIAQTAEKRPSVVGSSAGVGDMRIVNAHFEAPEGDKYEAGEQAELILVVTSMGAEDELVSVAVEGTPATITASGEGAGTTSAPGAVPSGSASPSTVHGTPDSEAGAASVSASTDPSPSSAPAASASVPIPSAGRVYFSSQDGDASIEATLPSETFVSSLVPVTMTFRDAGEVTFNVPVSGPADEVERVESDYYTPSEGAEGGH